MAKITNLFTRLPTNLTTDPRVMEAGIAAFGLHVGAWLWCQHHLSDGLLPRAALRAVCPGVSGRQLESLAHRLEQVGLWTPEGPTWRIAGFTDANFTRREVQERAEINAHNGAKGGRPKGESAETLNESADVETDSVSTPETEPETLTTHHHTNEARTTHHDGRAAAEAWVMAYANRYGTTPALTLSDRVKFDQLAALHGTDLVSKAIGRFLALDDADLRERKHPIGFFAYRCGALVQTLKADDAARDAEDRARQKTLATLKERQALMQEMDEARARRALAGPLAANDH